MERNSALIVAAIANRQVLRVIYPPGMRLVEPHAFGRSSAGDLLLRAYQTEGASASGEHERWKLFRVDRIEGLEPSGVIFDGPRPEYKRGDRAMRRGIIAEL